MISKFEFKKSYIVKFNSRLILFSKFCTKTWSKIFVLAAELSDKNIFDIKVVFLCLQTYPMACIKVLSKVVFGTVNVVFHISEKRCQLRTVPASVTDK